jgi:hypothetical protein
MACLFFKKEDFILLIIIFFNLTALSLSAEETQWEIRAGHEEELRAAAKMVEKQSGNLKVESITIKRNFIRYTISSDGKTSVFNVRFDPEKSQRISVEIQGLSSDISSKIKEILEQNIPESVWNEAEFPEESNKFESNLFDKYMTDFHFLFNASLFLLLILISVIHIFKKLKNG